MAKKKTPEYEIAQAYIVDELARDLLGMAMMQLDTVFNVIKRYDIKTENFPTPFLQYVYECLLFAYQRGDTSISPTQVAQYIEHKDPQLENVYENTKAIYSNWDIKCLEQPLYGIHTVCNLIDEQRQELQRKNILEAALTGKIDDVRLIEEIHKYKKIQTSQEPISAGDLLRKNLPDPEFIIKDIFAVGLTFLYGKPKLGKSWLALDLAVAVAAGGSALSKEKCNKHSVLYLALEDTESSMQKRLCEKQSLYTDEIDSSLLIQTEFSRWYEGGKDALEQRLESNKNIRLVIIDTFALMRSLKQRAANVYIDDYLIVQDMRRFATEKNIALVVIHHQRKGEISDTTDVMDTANGTGGITGAADTNIFLLRKRHESTAVLEIHSRLFGPEQRLALRMRSDIGAGFWECIGDANTVELNENQTAIITTLKNSETPLTSKEISDSLNMNASTCRWYLSQMIEKNLISNSKKGYIITNTSNTTNISNTTNTSNTTSNIQLAIVS